MDGGSAPLTSEQQMNVFRLRDKMSLLNGEFLKVLQGFYTEKNHYDFSGTMKSYMEHVKQLRTMYKVGDNEEATEIPAQPAAVRTEKSTEPATIPFQRKFAKANRRNGSKAAESPKPTNTTIFAASSPAATAPTLPKFGDISVITKDAPTPIFSKPAVKAAPAPAPSEPVAPAPAAARKRAIRGGGPLGGSESVVFKSGAAEQQKSTASTTKIPDVTIKFPEPSKDFWTKGSASKTTDAPSGGGSLFAFLGKEDKEPAKFTGFSFGKKPETDEKNADEPPAKLTFGSPINKESTESPSKPSLFGGSVKPSLFGKPPGSPLEESSSIAPKPIAPLSFGGGSSLFGGSSTSSGAPTLSFGSATGTSTVPTLSFGSGADSSTASTPKLTFGSGAGGLFAGLAQKAMDGQVQQKTDGREDEEGEYVPPKAEAVENEEPDAVLSSKVSVFKFADKAWTKLGVGMLHIKDTDGKQSVLIRAATTTGTVWLNALCNKAMKATKADEKGEKIRLTCPTSIAEMTTMMIRFGTAEGATKFTEKVEELTK
ncbi:unnamed protein product [Caenorhabditis sp. 36 PRJEB53466]|nr:unnamed protein product [Caenorhabditis sp. 36 PRJEB53466]